MHDLTKFVLLILNYHSVENIGKKVADSKSKAPTKDGQDSSKDGQDSSKDGKRN